MVIAEITTQFSGRALFTLYDTADVGGNNIAAQQRHQVACVNVADSMAQPSKGVLLRVVKGERSDAGGGVSNPKPGLVRDAVVSFHRGDLDLKAHVRPQHRQAQRNAAALLYDSRDLLIGIHLDAVDTGNHVADF